MKLTLFCLLISIELDISKEHIMRTVEFVTKADGNIIHIPEKYKEFASKNLKIILMMEDDTEKKRQRKAGSAKGKIVVSDDFEKPLSEEIINRFYQ